MDIKPVTQIVSGNGGKVSPTETCPPSKPASLSLGTGTHFASSTREMHDGYSWPQHLIEDLHGLRMSKANSRALEC